MPKKNEVKTSTYNADAINVLEGLEPVRNWNPSENGPECI